MKQSLKRTLAGVAGAIGLSLAASASYALPTLITPDGAIDPFGGFEWNQAGSAMVTGPIVSGGTITTEFMSNADAVNLIGGAIAATPNLFPTNPAGTYEYTVYATITETVTCAGVAIGDPCGATAEFSATGGQYWIFFDTTPDSNLVTGAGVTDGDLLIAGSVLSGGGAFTLIGTGGIGGFAFTGDVDFTNALYVSDLDASTAAATLQFGNFTTNWTQPTGFALFPPSGGTQGITGLLLQADANQSFQQLPEPGALLLLSTVLGGIGFASRRRSKAA